MPIVKNTEEINGEEVTILIEVDDVPSEESPWGDLLDGSDNALNAVNDLFSKGMALSRNCAKLVVDSIYRMDDAVRPNELEVQFAIALESEVGAVLAKAKTGAQLQVTMTWKQDEEKEGQPSR